MRRTILFERVFRTPDHAVEVLVSIHQPKALPDGKASRCEYEIRSGEEYNKRSVMGVDDYQAVENAFAVVRAIIESIEKKRDIYLGYRS